ncbi:hypothetical protein I4U23_001579 [Adineta vaga]|nr:hypothetical protein I4U23_001579 [Adineta vaga]
MNRRKSKLSIIQWLYNSIAIIFGIIPQSRRISKIKRCNNNLRRSNKTFKVHPKQRFLRSKGNLVYSDTSKISILNNNNYNRNFESEDNQYRILCLQVENDQVVEQIQNLSKKIRIIDFEELMKFIQLTTMKKASEDVSTMTTNDLNCCQQTSCFSLMTQSENTRRLKALEFIRLFMEKNKEEFCHYLINEERLCQRKTLAIYQMIKEFLKILYHSESEQK